MKFEINMPNMKKVVDDAASEHVKGVQRRLDRLTTSQKGQPVASITPLLRKIFNETGITIPEYEYEYEHEYAATISEGSRVILKVQPAH